MLSFRGFTLVELLIATAISSLVLSFSASHIAYLYHSHQQLNRHIALRDEMRTLQRLLEAQLQQADFIMRAPSTVPSSKDTSSSITISQFDDEPLDSCITFTTDKDRSGDIPLSSNELVGFRLRDNALEQSVSGARCNSKGWHDITDARTTLIAGFSITHQLTTPLGSMYLIALNASSRQDQNITYSLHFTVHVPNARD